MIVKSLQEQVDALTAQVDALKEQIVALGVSANEQITAATTHMPVAITHDGSFFFEALTVLVLAAFVGYYVIWNVTPALHAPLMGITNAISSVIIVGAIIAAGPLESSLSKTLGFLGIVLASINIFGGFVVTNRMLSMFKKKK
jgi:NAD(P) transhydrogenase subunit alpha